jgi:DNA-binding CsgD family transcriptional regulator
MARAPLPAGLVRCGAELVELSERFYRGVFVGTVVFVGLAAIAALALLSLRRSDAGFGSITVVVTALLAALAPVAVWHAAALYRVLRNRQEAQLALVLLAAAIVMYPLRSELWWPSCALLMLLATLVPLRRVLEYCLVVLLANLAAHAAAGDLTETPPVTIIGLWVGYVFWSSAFAIFIDRLAAHVLRLNTLTRPRRPPPLRFSMSEPSSARAAGIAGLSAAPSSARDATADAPQAAAAAMRHLTARQLQVVALLADGLRYDEVAECLAISVRQVQRHVTNAIARLGLRNTNELTAVAVAEELVPRRRPGAQRATTVT